ncbi:MAG: hypothetical protein JNM31_02855 [Flavobacteriales bacterium]|nr:hypothetical protein [Flavobacteriales bacterium]
MHRGTRAIIGLAGGSGSGKTSLMHAVMQRFPVGFAGRVSQDDYYHPLEQQVRDRNGRPNFDLPTALDLDQLATDLGQLRKGEVVRRREYTFNHRDREAGWVELRPAPVLFVEGLFVLHHEGIRAHLDLTVYIDVDPALQLQRRLSRDLQERGYSHTQIIYQWEQHVLPAYRTWLLPHRDSCDVLLDNQEPLPQAADRLYRQLTPLLDLQAV